MAEKSPSFAKKTFTDLVTALRPLLVLPSGLLRAITINFIDPLRKLAAPSSVSAYAQGILLTVSLSTSNGDDQFQLTGITISPSSSSSSPTSTEKTLGYVVPAVGENRITFMLVQNPNPSSSNQMLSAFQKSDLSKVMLAVVAPVTGGILALMSNNSPQLYSTLPHWLMPFVICTLTFGSTFIIQGILFRERFSRFAAVLEELGFLILVLGFCSLVTTIIPKNIVFVPWSCYVLTLLTLAVLRFHEAASAGSSTSSAISYPGAHMQIQMTSIAKLEASN